MDKLGYVSAYHPAGHNAFRRADARCRLVRPRVAHCDWCLESERVGSYLWINRDDLDLFTLKMPRRQHRLASIDGVTQFTVLSLRTRRGMPALRYIHRQVMPSVHGRFRFFR